MTQNIDRYLKEISHIVDHIQVYFDQRDGSINTYNPNRVKRDIEYLLSSSIKEHDKELKKKFIEIAIKGSKDRDEVKGLYLYTRFLKYLEG